MTDLDVTRPWSFDNVIRSTSILSTHPPMLDPQPADRRLIDEALNLYEALEAFERAGLGHVHNFMNWTAEERRAWRKMSKVLNRIRGEVKP